MDKFNILQITEAHLNEMSAMLPKRIKKREKEIKKIAAQKTIEWLK